MFCLLEEARVVVVEIIEAPVSLVGGDSTTRDSSFTSLTVCRLLTFSSSSFAGVCSAEVPEIEAMVELSSFSAVTIREVFKAFGCWFLR